VAGSFLVLSMGLLEPMLLIVGTVLPVNEKGSLQIHSFSQVYVLH
jgi:hypothetical protein